MQKLMGRAKKPQHPNKCAALCCCGGSRLSISSSSSSSSEQPDSLSNLAHAIVQSRLQRMITENRGTGCSNAQPPPQRRRRRSKFIVLLAVDQSSCNPRTEFREAIMEVITTRGMQEPEELRSLLNCYIQLNSREHRQVILEVFLEVCTSLLSL